MSGAIEQWVSLSAHNTLAVPARAEYFLQSHSGSDAVAALDFARERGISMHVLGGGSNVVLGERLPGLWLQQCQRGRELLEDTADEVVLRAGAGEGWHQLVAWTLDQGYRGLENLALIPGTAGAAPIQNIGAYGVELERFFLELSALDLHTGERRVFDRSECGFGYRDSVFKGALRDRYLIESISLRLPKRAAVEVSYPTLAAWLRDHGVSDPDARQVFDAVVAIRSSRLPDPAHIPNAGSFFKNPVVDTTTLHRLQSDYPEIPHYPADPGGHKLAAAWLIEQCGFKQHRAGPVQVHPEHALVLINPQRRPGSEIQEFAAQIAAAVQDRFGIALEQEPRSYV